MLSIARRIHVAIAVLAFAVAASAQSGDEAKARSPISVCELLERVQRYAGKTLTIRGEIATGSEEFALYGRNCEHPIVTERHTWVTAAWLTPPTGLAESPVDFSVDKASIQRMQDQVKSARASGRVNRVLVTVLGKVEARPRYFGGKGPNGDWIGNGFGHLNSYPVQIVFKAFQDVVVE